MEVKIKLKSYDHKLIDQSVKKIVQIADAAGCEVRGPIPLPTNKEVITILRSVHVNKDSREQFEVRTHKRLIIIKNANPQALNQLQRMNLPKGIEVEVKL